MVSFFGIALMTDSSSEALSSGFSFLIFAVGKWDNSFFSDGTYTENISSGYPTLGEAEAIKSAKAII